MFKYRLWGLALLILVGVGTVTVLSAPSRNKEGLDSIVTPGTQNSARLYAYLPIAVGPLPGPTPTPPPLPPPIPVSHPAPIDFAAIEADLQTREQTVAKTKIGFHTGMGGNIEGLNRWLGELDEAGIPIFLKSVDNAEPLYMVQQMARHSQVPHTLIFRRSGPEYDVPNYELPPALAAQAHWLLHKAAFPPELDPSLVWIETVNEVDKNRADWLAEFALETAALTLADGFRWAAFGWAAGEPEMAHWRLPAMREFLKLAAIYPDRLAIALHEYSYTATNVGNQYPYLIGRVQLLFQICDEYGIPRPTVLITEWGWEYQTVPAVDQAMADIAWATWMYGAYPEIKGAAIWYLGGGFGGIANEAQLFIDPLREYSLSHYFIRQQGVGSIDPALFQPPNTVP